MDKAPGSSGTDTGAGLTIGRVLAGRYELTGLLGRGGMGEVWAAVDARMARRVAVKLLSSGGGGNPQRLLREARVAGALNHPGVVTVHDLGHEPDGTVFVVMELVAGKDLARVLRKDGPVTVRDAIDWSGQCAYALVAAHEAGIVHRDLKPANVLLTPAGTIKVLDFGIARYTAATTRSSQVVGTPAYIAPERFTGQPGDARVDLYALGCILYELISGQPPFTAPDPMALMYAHLHQDPAPLGAHRANLPPGVELLVTELLAKDPTHRPATAREVHRRLHALTGPADRPDRSSIAPDPTAGPVNEAAVVVSPYEALAPWNLDAAAPAGTLVDHTGPAHERDTRLQDPRPPRGLSRRGAVLLALGTATAAGTALAVRFQGSDADDESSLRRRWEFTTGGEITTAPAAVDDTVYVASQDGNLYAVDAASGARRWVYRTGGKRLTNLDVTDGIVYVQSNPLEASNQAGTLHAVETKHGTAVWSIPFASYGGAPTVVDDVCYTSGAVTPTGAGRTGYTGRYHALDARTGAERWRFEADGGFYDRPAVVNGVVYLGCLDGNVYALDAATGRQRWAFRTGGAVQNTLTVDGAVYAASYDANVYAIDAASGTMRWAYGIGGPAGSLAVEGDILVVDSGKYVHAVNRAPGTRRWAWAAPDFVGSATLANGLVYIGSRDGRLYGIEITAGIKEWTFKTRGSIVSAPAVTREGVYVTSRDKRLYAIAHQ
ncbi:PQQ-binding-like beta-propeller repeat protein [Embleya sp. NPDC059237]|uniref:protein kinase domain-containing protein n=1 Tax=Embleya sp. NPDC059237 TaxID=3346784 RepID=UPI003692D807